MGRDILLMTGCRVGGDVVFHGVVTEPALFVQHPHREQFDSFQHNSSLFIKHEQKGNRGHIRQECLLSLKGNLL